MEETVHCAYPVDQKGEGLVLLNKPCLASCHEVSLGKIKDDRGILTAIEAGADVPFDIKRIYYLYEVSKGASRGGHAHKNLRQLFIAINGSFDIVLRDHECSRSFHLDNPSTALYVAPMVWRDILNFSSDAVCLVLASDHYDEGDYFRQYEEYAFFARKVLG